MRLLSVNDKRLALPMHQSVIEEFVQYSFGTSADSKWPLALGSFLYDPLNLLTLDARIAPYASSEREQIYKHLKKVNINTMYFLMVPM